jgi:NitT/TauT family transport system substrate-binding protein
MSRTANQISRRYLLQLMGGVAGSIALHGCTQGAGSSSGSAPLISIANPWPGYGGHYVALKKDLFKGAGVEVQELFFQSASEGLTAFLAGKADVAWLTSGDAVQAAAQDPTVRIIYVVDYSNGSDGIIGRGIKSPADLKGKKVARENLLFENVLLRAYLEKGGLTEADIQIQDMTAADGATAFAAKQVDVAVTYEPWMTKAAKQGGGEVVFTTKDTNLIVDVVATRQKVITSRKADLQAYLKAIDQGVKLVTSGDAEAIKIVADKLGGISVDETKEQIAGVKIFDIEMNKSIGFNPTNANNLLKNLELTVQVGKDMKLVGDMKLEDLYDSSIVMGL